MSDLNISKDLRKKHQLYYNDIKHINGSKINSKSSFFTMFYAKHKCLSLILIWVFVSHKYFFFLFPNWEKTDMELEKKVAIF